MKVSLVVATYQPGAGLDVLLDSLDRQTLPTAEWEVVWVDDGSPDDTYDRLLELAKTRPNYVVDRIENSGWPGRPRNVGIRRACGDYLFFADHDDHLFPEALERMSRFATENNLDMVLPKEVVKGWGRPGWASWRRQQPLLHGFDQATLQCITPHKLYRREWVLANEIFFPEGRVRLEDFDYNAQAWAATERIGVLADYPCYQWILHGGNSHLAGYDFDVYWSSFERSLQPILRMPGDSERRAQLLVRWYRSRILERYGPRYVEYTDGFRDRLDDVVRRLLPDFPPSIDPLLNAADRPRSALIRAGDRDGLLALAKADAGATHTATSTAHWESGRLTLSLTGVLANADGTPMAFENRDGAIIRSVPADLSGSAADGIDIGPDLARTVGEVIIRARESSVDWILPTVAFSLSAEPGAERSDRLELRWSLSAVLDPRTAAGGSSLEPDVWDVYFRLDGLGWAPTLWFPMPDDEPAPALVAGLSLVAYQTRKGFLALDAADEIRTLIGSAQPRLANARVNGDDAVVLALPGVHAAGTTELDGVLRIGDREIAATLRGSAERATVTFPAVELLAGEPVRAQFGRRVSGVLFGPEARMLANLRKEPAPHNVATFLPPDVDQLVPSADIAYLRLARAGHSLTPLQRADAGLRPVITQQTIQWADGGLEFRLRGRLDAARETPAQVLTKDNRVLRLLPESIRGTAAGTTDITRALAHEVGYVVLSERGGNRRIRLPGTSSHTLSSAGEFGFEVGGMLDLQTVDNGQPLTSGVWDPLLVLLHVAAVSPAPLHGAVATALVAGQPVLLYTTLDGNLAIDTAETNHTLLGLAAPTLADATTTIVEGHPQLRIPLPNTHVSGTSTIAGRLIIDGEDVPARLVADPDAGAALIAFASELSRNNKIESQFVGRVSTPLFTPQGSRVTPQGSRGATLAGRITRGVAHKVRRRRR